MPKTLRILVPKVQRNEINIYDTEVQMLRNPYILSDKLVNDIKLKMRDNMKYYSRYITNLYHMTILNIIILFFSTLYGILYDNYLILFCSILVSVLNLVYNKDGWRLDFSAYADYKLFICIIPFSFIILPINFILFDKIILSITLSQILYLKFFYRGDDNYYSKLIKSKQVVDDLLSSPLLRGTKISRELLKINQKYYSFISVYLEKLKIFRIIALLLPLLLYPSFKYSQESIAIMIFISSLLTLFVVTKAYSLTFINPKLILYYCIVSAIFWSFIG